MVRTGLAQKVREAAKGFGGPFRALDLVAVLDVRTYRECRHGLDTALRDMKRRGELEVLERRLYRYKPLCKERTKLDIIWHLVRSHRQFSTDEMERMSGATRSTVTEYLRCLQRFGYIRQARRGHWQMVNDPGPATPVNTAKCARLKKRRISHKIELATDLPAPRLRQAGTHRQKTDERR